MTPPIWRCSVKTASPYEYLAQPTNLVAVRFDGQTYQMPKGENLAAALLAAGVRSTRENPGSNAPRAAFCMMGACYECRVRIDGASVQACMIQVRDGLVVEKMQPVGGQSNER